VTGTPSTEVARAKRTGEIPHDGRINSRAGIAIAQMSDVESTQWRAAAERWRRRAATASPAAMTTETFNVLSRRRLIVTLLP
jgi:hypothetical protein